MKSFSFSFSIVLLSGYIVKTFGYSGEKTRTKVLQQVYKFANDLFKTGKFKGLQIQEKTFSKLFKQEDRKIVGQFGIKPQKSSYGKNLSNSDKAQNLVRRLAEYNSNMIFNSEEQEMLNLFNMEG
jgi:hypothetical protein